MVNAPGLSGPVTLQFRGDWGQANMHRICGWLAQEVGDRAPAGSRFGIWSGRGGIDSLEALAAREVDIAIMTPAAAARMHARGLASTAGSLRWLRALGAIGQDDRLIACGDASLGATSLGQLSDNLDRLVIATCPDDGVNLVGWAAHRLLQASGLTVESVTAAGGRFLYDERPFRCIEAMRTGEANVLIQEAIMMPGWQAIANDRDVTYFAVDEATERAFADWAWPINPLPAGYLPQQGYELRALDFSDFVLLCHEDLDPSVAALVTWCLVKTRSALEAQYAMFPPGRGPVECPITVDMLMSAPVPLHPAAATMYERLREDDTRVGVPIWGNRPDEEVS